MIHKTPVEVLMDEHRLIERILKIVAAASNRLASREEVEVSIFERAIDFIRTFADRCHHRKEEDTLFPVFEQRGIPRQGGPIGVMLEEHEAGRRYVRSMAEALEKYKAGDSSQAEAVVENALSYVELLSQHIPKEDNILYPMGDRLITDEDRRRLIERFEEIEEKEIGEGVHEHYHRLVEELEREIGVRSPTETPP